MRLPENLPADLVSRRPEIVAARWRVDAMTHGVKEAKAEFYPDINLSAAIGLDAFGFGRFLSAASRTASVGPAIHLPIFDAGELRAQLKGRYADFDYAVASYNASLVTALSEVATQLANVRSSDAQLVDAQAAQDAARQADQLALVQYKSRPHEPINGAERRRQRAFRGSVRRESAHEPPRPANRAGFRARRRFRRHIEREDGGSAERQCARIEHPSRCRALSGCPPNLPGEWK